MENLVLTGQLEEMLDYVLSNIWLLYQFVCFAELYYNKLHFEKPCVLRFKSVNYEGLYRLALKLGLGPTFQ